MQKVVFLIGILLVVFAGISCKGKKVALSENVSSFTENTVLPENETSLSEKPALPENETSLSEKPALPENETSLSENRSSLSEVSTLTENDYSLSEKNTVTKNTSSLLETPDLPFKGYVHNPMDNPKAAADIVVNPKAVYGYSPNPESKRLRVYADYNWEDPVFVKEMQRKREEYHESVKELYSMIEKMKAEGKPISEIAQKVSRRRNEIRLESYKGNEEELKKVKKSNLDTFGNENGGTPEFFYNKYGSWEAVLEKALSTNAGADACLGLYDKYFETYLF